MDTALPLGLIQALERHYEMEKIIEAYRLEGGWWNDVFAVRTENRKYVVRVRHRTTLIESLHYEHALLSFMSKRIEEVPMPLPRRDGSTFFIRDERIVTMYPCMPGSIPDRHESSIRTAAAAMLARLHLAALDVPNVEPNPGHSSLAELNWDRNQSWDWHEVKQFLANRLDERQASSEFDEQQLEYIADIQKGRVEIEQQKERISAWLFHLSASRRGLLLAPIHGDFYRGNLLCTGGRVTAVIDWDECRPEWLCYELARSTWEFCKDLRHNDLNRQHATEFIQAYKAAGGPVPFDEFELILPFVRCVRLMEVLFHLGLAAKGEPWDPEYTLHNWKSLQNLYHTEDLNWGEKE